VGSEDAAADAAWAALYGSGNSSTVDKQLRTAKLQVSQLRESFAVGLEIRLDHFLPFDSRRKRVTALLADPDNKGFWDTLPSLYLPDAKTLEENRLDRFAVAPHPADEKIWYVMLGVGLDRRLVMDTDVIDLGSVSRTRSSRSIMSCAGGVYNLSRLLPINS
jgi:hypothetical protein